ncbi:glycosyltransferase [bacterium]|nr:glycosyltransferase [bacterium]
MKIGIYLGDIKKPNSYGELTFEHSFIDELIKADVSHEFIFYYFGKKNIFQDKEKIKFTCLKQAQRPILPSVKVWQESLNKRLKKDKVNLAIFLTPYLYEHIEVPYFAIVRDVTHRVLPHFPEFSLNSIFIKREQKFLRFLRGASKIITGNQIAKDDIRTLYNIIDDNIFLAPLPYPVWIEHIEDNPDFLAQNNLTKNSFILYPAQFWAHKNHIRLILASQIMKEQGINLKIVFTGADKGNKNYLINKAQELDLANEILFLDYVSHKELACLYKNAYALVYPSLGGIDSISALEAMYFECPVLISNHPGYNLQLRKAALYFNALDEVDIVKKILNLNDIALKDDLIAKGKSLIQENHFRDFIQDILKIADDFYLTRLCWSLEKNYQNKNSLD